ncbi:MAG: hypothetical protein MUO62_06850 [Anaerolineales bacterium]|nr:hypothetical protein [Anaerolineales bacterium]
MKRDRFLMVILGTIALLVVLAVILFFVRQEPQEYRSTDIPEGVVWNYVLALQEGDYHQAYAYLQEVENKPDFTGFQQTFLQNEMMISRTAVQLGDANITAESARIDVMVIHTNNDPFNRSWDENATALLIRQDEEWRIASMPYPYWGWDWYIIEKR